MSNLSKVTNTDKTYSIVPVININDFPALDTQTADAMEMEIRSFVYGNDCLCYAYVRASKKYKWFIDLYFSFVERNASGARIMLRRFVIAPNHRMSSATEKDFIAWCNNPRVFYNERTCNNLFSIINRVDPDINISSGLPIGKVLTHAYYASHRSGVKEFFYKAGLDEIANMLDEFEDLDVNAGSVQGVFGGIPARMLRKMKPDTYRKYLKTRQARIKTARIYNAFAPIIDSLGSIGEFQLRYLNDCSTNLMEFDKNVLVAMGALRANVDSKIDGANSQIIYEMYMKYQRMMNSSDVDRRFFIQYPSVRDEDIEAFYKDYEFLEYYVGCKYLYEMKFEMLSRKWGDYKYRDEHFEIVIPDNMNDFLVNSKMQKSHPSEYVFRAIDGHSIIAFIRERNDVTEVPIVIEIADGDVKAADFNSSKSITISQLKFLAKFARVKGLELVLW